VLGVREGLFFPLGEDQTVSLQAPHRQIYGSTGQARYLLHAEAVDAATVDGL
jgi:hypothetical protein